MEKFPRSHRHQVGDRLVDAALELLMCLVDATYSRDKAGLLGAGVPSPRPRRAPDVGASSPASNITRAPASW